MWYYSFKTQPMALSKFLRLKSEYKIPLINQLLETPKQVEILSYCLMPNHFHLLVTQLVDGAISRYIGNLQNSFAHYYNIQNDRHGPLFESQYKAVRMESDEQLLHGHRYVHINPLTSFVVKSYQELQMYPWSSLPEYLGSNQQIFQISNPKPILSFFKSIDEYEQFLSDQVLYQQELHLIKHLTFE
jgi:putative transposase